MKHTYFKSSKKEFKDSIVNQNENHEAAGLRHLAFEVDDLSVAKDELDNKGIAHAPIRTDEYTGKRFVFFSDPDGLPIELYEK